MASSRRGHAQPLLPACCCAPAPAGAAGATSSSSNSSTPAGTQRGAKHAPASVRGMQAAGRRVTVTILLGWEPARCLAGCNGPSSSCVACVSPQSSGQTGAAGDAAGTGCNAPSRWCFMQGYTALCGRPPIAPCCCLLLGAMALALQLLSRCAFVLASICQSRRVIMM